MREVARDCAPAPVTTTGKPLQEHTQLRRSLRAARRGLTPADRHRFSLAIATCLSKYMPFRRARTVGLFVSTPEEVDTAPVEAACLSLDKQIFLPVINTASWRQGRMMFHRFVPGQTRLRRNRYNIAEPVHRPGESVPGIQLDLVCVPMVGFNSQCDRIGMGGGYYDEAFQKPSFKATKLVGLAFECQRADFAPAPHDVAMQAVITENGILERKK